MASSSNALRDKARGLFRKNGGHLRTSQAIRLGIHPRTLYAMRDEGELECLSRGVYRLADLPPLSNPDLATVALRIPQGVVCLVSALSFHELTTQVPHEVYVAVRRDSEKPRLEHPPIRVFWFSAEAHEAGVQTHRIDNIDVRLFDPEKTLADCFKYRNKIGMEVFLEALRLYRERPKKKADAILRYATVCGVQRVIRPYLEAGL